MELVCDEELKYHLEYKELIKYTDNFSKENYVGDVDFGKVYRGKIEHSIDKIQHVMVKIWGKPKRYTLYHGDNETRLMQEVMLLRHEKLKSHPGSIELYGYCWDNQHLGVVYNLKPLDTLLNLVPKDSFTWVQRIKVAIGFGRLLKYLHSGDPAFKPFLVRNISSAHIVLDEVHYLSFKREYNPRLFDYGMISGGFFPDRTVYEKPLSLGSFGYVDYNTLTSGHWSQTADVFAFGCLLLNLITKKLLIDDGSSDPIYIDDWAWMYYKGNKSTDRPEKLLSSFVDPSLETDPDFSYADGRKITKLAMSCINLEPTMRPLMKQVMKNLLKLQVVNKHSNFLGL